MAKTGKQQDSSLKTAAGIPPVMPVTPEKSKQDFSIYSFKVQCIIIAIIGLIFYFNTFGHEYALDDRPIIVENEYVKQGVSGIPKILTSDAFESYLRAQNSGDVPNGGRYRPLSIVTFAIEQQLLGTRGSEEVADSIKQVKGNMLTDAAVAKINTDMHVRHVVNVLLYILSVMVILYFMRTVLFPDNAMIPFLAALIFIVHPLHTEVVANVKSRDEILSLMFICLTLIYSFRYYDGLIKKDLYRAALLFFLALLSKEYALLLIVLLPLSISVIRKVPLAKSFQPFMLLLASLGLYLLMRFAAVHHGNAGGADAITDDVMNVPLLYATPLQKAASVIANVFYYIRLLFYPHPLSSDYTYNQIPYSDFSNPMVYVSFICYGGLILLLYHFYTERHKLFFPLAFFLFNIALIGNVFFNIGAPLGERLAYHSSLGFAIIIAWLLFELSRKIQPQKAGMGVIAAIMGIIVVLSGYKTIGRNKAWKNDPTLYTTDVKTSPNSVMILGNAGSACIDIADQASDSTVKRQLYAKGIQYFSRAISIHPKFATAYLNRGVALYKAGFQEKAMKDWDTVRVLYPNHPNLPYVYRILSNYLYTKAIKFGKAGVHDSAAFYFEKAAVATPDDADVWFNVGFANYSMGNYEKAVQAFIKSLHFKPNNARAKEYMELSRSHLHPPG